MVTVLALTTSWLLKVAPVELAVTVSLPMKPVSTWPVAVAEVVPL